MSTQWVVLKYGGTSVAGRSQWEAIAVRLRSHLSQGNRVLLVCSAVTGVTNALADLANDPGSELKLAAVLARHRKLAAGLGVPDADWIGPAESALRKVACALVAGTGFEAQAELLAMGEWLSTRIGACFLQRELPVSWLDAREILQVRDEPELSPARQWLSASCEPGLDQGLLQRLEPLSPVVITQGYVASTRDGRTALLGRGGSDTSAALLAGRLGCSQVEIWTDVPGLFSADPRLVPQARLLAELGYDEALEMAASGAKVVHPRCISAAAATCTPILILDTARPHLAGTRIAHTEPGTTGERSPGVKAITCQKDMVILLLQNIDTRREVGFLARVFDIFRRNGVSIDLVATSETTTTVAINGPANHLDAGAMDVLIRELQAQCTVQVHTGCVCINLVGSSVRTALVKLASVMNFFEDHALLMLSQSANDLCLSLLINAQDHETLLRLAHHALIPADLEPGDSVFGPRWQDIQA
jgi:diaminopimelate decarboxylase/aspartate kinase